jgi:hypothetical protein
VLSTQPHPVKSIHKGCIPERNTVKPSAIHVQSHGKAQVNTVQTCLMAMQIVITQQFTS